MEVHEMGRLQFLTIPTAFLAFCLLGISGHALADKFIDGLMAYDKGDYAKALSLFEQSAETGNARAQYWLGTIYEEGKIVRRNYGTAVKWLKVAASGGLVDAQYNLAVMYRQGQGVPKSNKEALNWLNRATEQGHSRAQSDLGSMYAFGIGIRKNHQKAIELFRKSAAQCDAIGQVNLGRLYVTGTGVRQNVVTAYMWFHIAATQGLGSEHVEGKAEAKEDRQILSDSMNSRQIRKAIALAEPYVKKCLQFRINRL